MIGLSLCCKAKQEVRIAAEPIKLGDDHLGAVQPARLDGIGQDRPLPIDLLEDLIDGARLGSVPVGNVGWHPHDLRQTNERGEIR